MAAHIDEYVIDKIDASLHTFSQEDIVQKISEISQSVPSRNDVKMIINEDGDEEYTVDLKGSIGTTSFITTISDPTIESNEDIANGIKKTLVTEFDKESWRQNKRAEGWSSEVIANTETSWATQADYGTEVHALFESMINNTDFQRIEMPETVELVMRKQFTDLINTLRNKHGENAKFMVEVPIVSKNINDAYTKVQLSDGSNLTSINGRIDLLIIDESGTAHIYDIKTSTKDVGLWTEVRNTRLGEYWHSTKKLAAKYQLAIYAQILRQHGIKVGTTGIIPIKLEVSRTGEQDSIINGLSRAFIPTNGNNFNIIGWNNSPYGVSISAKIGRILPLTTFVDNVDLVSSIQEPMTKMFPNYEMELQVQRRDLMIDNLRRNDKIVEPILQTDSRYIKGKYQVHDYGRGVHTYCNTEEEITSALQALITYENDNRANELTSLAQSLIDISEGRSKFEDLYTDEKKSSYVRRVFFKYINNGWTLQNNPSYIAAGLFIFEKNGLIEIVTLSQNPTHAVVNLGLGNTILGATKKNYNVDEHKYLKATNGNIDCIKVMNFLNSNIDLIDNYRINRITSCNIWHQTSVENYSETLLYNFRELCDIHKIPIKLEEKHFSSTLQSTVATVQELCGEHLVSNIGLWQLTFDPNDIVQGTSWLLEKIELIKHLPNSASDRLNKSIEMDKFDFDDPVQYSYMILLRALNKLNGYTIHVEPDVAPWLDAKGMISAGSMLTSPGLSPSKNIQTVAQIKSVANQRIAEKILEYEPRLRKVIDAFYKSKNRNQIKGGEVSLFTNLFVPAENGDRYTQSFILKRPDDSSLSKEESAFITMFLDIVNTFKYNSDINRIERAKLDGTYYEVPLMMGSTQTLLYNQSVTTVAKAKLEEELNVLRLFSDEVTSLQAHQRAGVIHNRFRIDANTRHKMLVDHGPNKMETHLENLLRNVISTYVTEQVMGEMLPRILAVKVVLKYQHEMFGVIPENTVKYIDDYIKLNVYQQPIMHEDLNRVYKMLSVFRDISTTTALAFNYRSGMRELLQGIWIHITRSMADVYGEDRLKKRNLAKAWSFIFKDSLHNPNDVTLLDLMNITYGMANADILQIQERLSMSQVGALNFGSDQMFIFNKIPDIYHRMGILIAIMMEDGCWEAHSVKNNRLVYEFKKDKRFNLLNDPNANKDSKEYKQQHALYTTMREQFNREGFNLIEGDALPRAYTTQESASIKSFADIAFGHYDKDQQMLAKHQFLGAFMLHFKTFLSAKLETWILKPGTYNQGAYKIQYDSNGNMKMRIYTIDPVTGEPKVRIGLESDVKDGEYAEPYKEWEGRFMEGILWSMLDYVKAISKLDHKELQNLYNHPTKKANLRLFITDMGLAYILMWLLSAWMNNEDRDVNTVTHFIEQSTYNAIGEAPFFATMAGMFGDFNPPAVNTMSNLWKQFSGVITEDKNVLDAAVNSFGALSDVRYFINRVQ